MVKKIRVYDSEIEELLENLDEEVRNFDAAKYGLPLHFPRLKGIVYDWIISHSKKD